MLQKMSCRQNGHLHVFGLKMWASINELYVPSVTVQSRFSSYKTLSS